MRAEIAEGGKPAPLTEGSRWVVERTTGWTSAHNKLVWRTNLRAAVVDFWFALSEVVIIVVRLLREGWSRYRWDARLRRKP